MTETVNAIAKRATPETAQLGWQILEQALRDLRLDLIVGVAGKPITPTMDALWQTGEGVYVNHEAVAVQMAFGVAGVGARSAVLIKQVGMNAAMDVLACAAPHRSGGSMVVIVGDDPGGAYSSNEGDARMLAAAIDLPCLEPAGAADIPAALFDALALSTNVHVPVVLRVTSRMLLHDRATVAKERRTLPLAGPFDPSFWLTDAEGQRRRLLQELHRLPEEGAALHRPGKGNLRVLGCGDPVAVALADAGIQTLAIRRVHPLPERAIADFLSADERPVLVFEDGGPVIEDAARALARGPAVHGRRSGQVPWTGIIDVQAAIEAVRASRPVAQDPILVVEGNPQANLKPYGSIWQDVAELGLAPVAVDAGHSSAAVWQPGYPAPFCVGLGSAVGVAAGVARTAKRPALAVAGDMATFHAGILGLLEVVRDQLPVITFVCDDGSASYTGGQPHPGSDPGPHQRRVDLMEMARGIGIDLVETIPQDRMTSQVLRPLLKRLMDAGRPSLVVIDAR